MTNREYLQTLSTKQLVQFIMWDKNSITRECTQSDKGLEEWLDSNKDDYFWGKMKFEV